MADACLKPWVIKTIQHWLDAKGLALGTQWNHIVTYLLEEGVAYKLVINCKEILCHPENRCKLGLNHHVVHRNGLHICITGADVEMLVKATLFEIDPAEPIHSQVMEFNKRLVQLSNGTLAPVSGRERYMTVSCGHCCAFVRALLAGCCTPQAKLGAVKVCDGESKLMLAKEALITKDPQLKIMCDVGWEWTVIPHWVEKEFPDLPRLAQKALNKV